MRINLTKKDLVNLIWPSFFKLLIIREKNSSIRLSEICLENPICIYTWLTKSFLVKFILIYQILFLILSIKLPFIILLQTFNELEKPI